MPETPQPEAKQIDSGDSSGTSPEVQEHVVQIPNVFHLNIPTGPHGPLVNSLHLSDLRAIPGIHDALRAGVDALTLEFPGGSTAILPSIPRSAAAMPPPLPAQKSGGWRRWFGMGGSASAERGDGEAERTVRNEQPLYRLQVRIDGTRWQVVQLLSFDGQEVPLPRATEDQDAPRTVRTSGADKEQSAPVLTVSFGLPLTIEASGAVHSGEELPFFMRAVTQAIAAAHSADYATAVRQHRPFRLDFPESIPLTLPGGKQVSARSALATWRGTAISLLEVTGAEGSPVNIGQGSGTGTEAGAAMDKQAAQANRYLSEPFVQIETEAGVEDRLLAYLDTAARQLDQKYAESGKQPAWMTSLFKNVRVLRAKLRQANHAMVDPNPEGKVKKGPSMVASVCVQIFVENRIANVAAPINVDEALLKFLRAIAAGEVTGVTADAQVRQLIQAIEVSRDTMIKARTPDAGIIEKIIDWQTIAKRLTEDKMKANIHVQAAFDRVLEHGMSAIDAATREDQVDDKALGTIWQAMTAARETQYYRNALSRTAKQQADDRFAALTAHLQKRAGRNVPKGFSPEWAVPNSRKSAGTPGARKASNRTV